MTTKNFHRRKLSKGPNKPKMDPLSLTTKVKIHDDGLDQSDLVNQLLSKTPDMNRRGLEKIALKNKMKDS